MLSLIIPVYKNSESIPSLLTALTDINEKVNGDLEVVFVVDGSPDNSYQLLYENLPSLVFKSQLILLSRNFGSFVATRAGLQQSSGNYFAVMAADLQEPPDLVVQMYEKLKTEELDVIVGVRESRDDPLLSKLSSSIFWYIYRKFVVPEIPHGGVDMFACNKIFRDVLLTLDERHSSLISQIFWIGFRRDVIVYKRLKREHGKSAWTFKKKLIISWIAFSRLQIYL